MIVAQYFVEFMFYSFLGWIWESIYCLAKERKWADRGFLFGPICPIYGSCAVGTSIVFNVFGLFSSPDFPLWGIFLICFFASVVAEYSTSWVLEKRFHARWWDYSTMPLNIRGRICVPVSIAFGLAGIMIVKYLIPAVEGMRGVINPLLYEITSILFAVLIGVDFALTEASLSSLLTEVEKMHNDFNIRAQENYEKLTSAQKRIEQKLKEEKELAEIRRRQLADSYAAKLSINQKRVLPGIKKFMPKTRTKQDISHVSNTGLTDSLRDSVRKLRK